MVLRPPRGRRGRGSGGDGGPAVDTDPVRQAFVHDAVVTMEAGGDARAPGAAVTSALRGHRHREPPCPLPPHRTGARRSGDEASLRVLPAAGQLTRH